MRISILVGVLVSTSVTLAAPDDAVRGALERIDNGHSKLTFVLRTHAAELTEVVETIDVPVGMTATAIVLSSRDTEPVRSLAFESVPGKVRYERIVAAIKDPALLEYVGPRRAILHVFPVSKAAPATVVVELTATALAEANGIERLAPRVSFIAAPNLTTDDVVRLAFRAASVPRVDDDRLERL